MKNIFIGLFTLTSVLSIAQAKLGMGIYYNISPSDTVVANTTVTLTTVVLNKGNVPYFGTYTLNVGLLNGSVTPIAANTNSAGINPSDSVTEVSTFTAQTSANGWKVAGMVIPL